MAYTTGIMNKRITIAQRYSDGMDAGWNGAPQYKILGTFWAAEDFTKGKKALQEGAFDAYDIVMFRMRYNKDVDRWCLIQYQERWYQIQSFNASYQDNQIQITAIELANQQVNLVAE